MKTPNLKEIQGDILRLKFSTAMLVSAERDYILNLLYFIEKVLKERKKVKNETL